MEKVLKPGYDRVRQAWSDKPLEGLERLVTQEILLLEKGNMMGDNYGSKIPIILLNSGDIHPSRSLETYQVVGRQELASSAEEEGPRKGMRGGPTATALLL